MATLPEQSQPTVDAIYEAYEEDQESGFRYHLGASLIGVECKRSLWYSFRWATISQFKGRMLRLFQTGHLAEARFVADLRRIGVTVHDHEYIDPDKYAEDYDKPVKQIGVRDEFGHFGGSLDGMAVGFIEAPKTWHVCEFKTHNEKSFAKLKIEGVLKSKPRHYAQMQVYMHLIGATRSFYMAVNKNNDELYRERIEYDVDYAMRLIAKASEVVTSPTPPKKISNDPSWSGCKGLGGGAYRCDHYDVCHGGAVPDRHCRSCLHSTPIEGGLWHCGLRDDWQLSREDQEKGCDKHLYIPGLIPAEQVDSTGNTITYIYPDGTEWIDGKQ